MKIVGRVARIAAFGACFVLARSASAAETNSAPVQRPRAMLDAPVTEPSAAPVAASDPPPPVATTTIAAPTTTTPAPTAGAGDPTQASPPRPRVTPSSGGTSIHKSAKQPAKKFAHDGFAADLRIGTLGCLRGLCSGGHNVRPGARIDGFIGGNIRGFVDIGLAGGWGSMTSDVAPGTNVLSLYGLDPYLLQQALTLLGGGQALGIDLTALNVTDSKLRAAQGGPLLRIHFIPRGRFAAYVGSGVQYNLFRARYSTSAGDAKVDFHGLAVPIEAGFGVHVHEHVAVGIQFDYLWTWYALANLDHAGQKVTVPVRILDEAARMQNTSLRGQLPQFWTFGLMLRARV